MSISSFLDTCRMYADKAMDFIPVVSTFNNIVDIFLKKICPKTVEDGIAKGSRYYKQINKKDISRCTLLLVPVVGNLIHAGFTVYNLAKKKPKEPTEKQLHQPEQGGSEDNIAREGIETDGAGKKWEEAGVEGQLSQPEQDDLGGNTAQGTMATVEEKWEEAMPKARVEGQLPQPKQDDLGSNMAQGTMAMEKKQWKEAIQFYTKAFTFPNRSDSLYQYIGECYERLGDIDQAIKWYTKGIETESCADNNESRGNIGEAKEWHGKPSEANICVDTNKVNLARCYLQLHHDTTEIKKLLIEAIKHPNQDTSYVIQALLLLYENDLAPDPLFKQKLTEDQQELVKKANSGDISSIRALAHNYCFGENKFKPDTTEWLRWLHKLAQQGDPEGQFELGHQYYYIGNDEKAIQWLTQSNLAKAHTLLGFIKMTHNKVDEAYLQYMKAKEMIEKDKGQELFSPFDQYCIGLIQEKRGNHEDAVNWYTQAAKAGNGEAQFVFARYYAEGNAKAKIEKNIEKAKEYLKLVLGNPKAFSDQKEQATTLLKALESRPGAGAQPPTHDTQQVVASPQPPSLTPHVVLSPSAASPTTRVPLTSQHDIQRSIVRPQPWSHQQALPQPYTKSQLKEIREKILKMAREGDFLSIMDAKEQHEKDSPTYKELEQKYVEILTARADQGNLTALQELQKHYPEDSPEHQKYAAAEEQPKTSDIKAQVLEMAQKDDFLSINDLALRCKEGSQDHAFWNKQREELLKQYAERNNLFAVKKLQDHFYQSDSDQYMIYVQKGYQLGDNDSSERLGRMYMGYNDLVKAEACLNGVQTPFAHRSLGDIAKKKGDWKTAIQFYEKLPQVPSLYLSIGECYEKLGDIAQAKEWYTKGINSKSEVENNKVNLARCYLEYEPKNASEAKNMLLEIIKDRKDPNAAQQAAWLLLCEYNLAPPTKDDIIQKLGEEQKALIKQAEEGNLAAIRSLTKNYLDGKNGFPKDTLEYLRWIHQGAKLKDPEMLSTLGDTVGEGISPGRYISSDRTPNYKKAAQCYVEAKNLERLRLRVENAISLDNWGVAYEYCKTAYDMKCPEFTFDLATIEEHRGHYEDAMKFAREDAETTGNPSDQFFLAQHYATGLHNTPKNTEEARKIFNSIKKSPKASYKLKSEADEWLKKI